MSLFRLDFLNDDDATAGAAVPGIAGDFLSRHMTTARKGAIQHAQASGRAILISRIGQAGIVRPCLRVYPDGTCKRPAGTVAPPREDCTKDSGRPCFCSACRAARRGR